MTGARPHAALCAETLRHLDVQIGSAERLLACVLRQGGAIRGRDVGAVLTSLSEIQGEMGARERLEVQRSDLLRRAGAALGLPPGMVTLEALTTLMTPAEGEAARARSAQLRGLLTEIAREHGMNRALMRQELSFLDHLVGLLSQEPAAGYKPPGEAPAAAGRPAGQSAQHRILDLQA
ncbi:MAG: flagellar protein FlgN [Solirubrobacteraceae bacterium]|nr:flagellar protein FlgN [Solirubrobacteraceae bacterium]